jgi:hypothetical protein
MEDAKLVENRAESSCRIYSRNFCEEEFEFKLSIIPKGQVAAS